MRLEISDPDLRELNRELNRFVVETGADFLEEAKTVGRGMAVSLAKSTFPFGSRKADAEGAFSKVKKEVGTVFATPAKVYANLPEDRRGGFWRAMRAKDWAEAERQLRGTLYDVPIVAQVDAERHEARRTGPRRNVKGKQPSAILRDGRRVATYVRKRQRRVGLAKSAWAHASADLAGHARGIPAWAGVKRHKAKLGGARVRRRGLSPGVTIYSDARHGRANLPFRYETRAIKIGSDRLRKRMRMALSRRAARV